MDLIELQCQKCGATLKVDSAADKIVCQYCKAEILIDDEATKIKRVEEAKLKARQENHEQQLKEQQDIHEQQIRQQQEFEQQQAVKKFKTGPFGIIVIIAAVFAVLFCATSFKDGKVLAGLCAALMAGLLIWGYLMKASIVKEPKKGTGIIAIIVGFIMNDIEMHEVLPEPKTKSGRIIANRETDISIYITNTSKEDYNSYVEQCKEKGFTVDSKKDTSSYDAYNADGYKLRIYYSDYSKEYNIDLEAPIEMKENAWISTPLSQKIPEPESKYGKLDTNSDKYYRFYAGKTSKDAYSNYANTILNAGFNKEYSSGDTFFHGTNEEGYKVDLNYLGNNTMIVYIKAPEKSTTSSKTEETKNETKEETKQEAKNETKKEETKPVESSSSSNKTGLSKEFKDAMDSYEAFIDEYCAFMKKYSSSNGTNMSMLTDYTKYMSKLTDMSAKFDKWKSEDMSNEELKYYTEVLDRTNKKLAEAAQ